MSEIKELRCRCCKCYDNFDGCRGFDCDVDFEFSFAKAMDIAKEMNVRIEDLYGMIKPREPEPEEDNELPDDFDPETDTKFLISFADAIDLGKKRLVDMETEELVKLRAELDFVLEARYEYE